MWYNIFLNLNDNSTFVVIIKHQNLNPGHINSFNHFLVGLYKIEEGELISSVESNKRIRNG